MADSDETDYRLSRRKMLALTLSGTAVGLAGCSGGGNDTTTSGGGGSSPTSAAATSVSSTSTSGTGSSGFSGSSPSNESGTSMESGTTGNTSGTSQNRTQMSSDQMAEPVVDMNISWLPGDANWNHRSNGQAAYFWVSDYTARTYWNDVTDWWLLKDDGYNYDSDTKTVTYEFRPEYGYWWNGDPVTAEDYRMQLEIDRLTDPEGSPWKSWSLEDKYTLKGKRKKQVNPILLGPSKAKSRVFEYRDTWRQWLEKLNDDTTDKARKSTQESMVKWKISTKQLANDGLANATYKLDDWSTTQLTWKRFDKHPYADQAPFETIKWHVGSGSAANQQITNDTIDVGIGQFPQELRTSSPEYLKTIYTNRSIQVRNLLFNYNNKHIGRRNVRRALVSILDWTRLVDFWNHKGGPVKQRQTGLPKALEDKWLGKKLIDQMVNYPLKSDPEQAVEFMKKAGYEKQGNTWKDSDGDSLKFNLMFGTYQTSEALGKALAQTWNQWGANVDTKPVTSAQWTSKVANPQGNWDTTIFLHGFDRLDALNYFDSVNQYNMRLGPDRSTIKGWLDDGKTHSPINGKPLKLTIPSKPGLKVGDDGQQINLYELVEELRTTQSEDRSREIIRTLSRYFNYDLPMFDAFPQVAASWGDTKNFEWPKDADLWHQKGSRAAYATLRKGILKPVSKQ